MTRNGRSGVRPPLRQCAPALVTEARSIVRLGSVTDRWREEETVNSDNYIYMIFPESPAGLSAVDVSNSISYLNSIYEAVALATYPGYEEQSAGDARQRRATQLLAEDALVFTEVKYGSPLEIVMGIAAAVDQIAPTILMGSGAVVGASTGLALLTKSIRSALADIFALPTLYRRQHLEMLLLEEQHKRAIFENKLLSMDPQLVAWENQQKERRTKKQSQAFEQAKLRPSRRKDEVDEVDEISYDALTDFSLGLRGPSLQEYAILENDTEFSRPSRKYTRQPKIQATAGTIARALDGLNIIVGNGRVEARRRESS